MSAAPSRSLSPARKAAHKVLLRVARDGAWAERVLHATFERQGLQGEDRALTTELVYGTLRHTPYLDYLLNWLVRRPLRKLPLPTLVALRMGAHQILNMRVPDHAAVDETVKLVAMRSPHQRGFANAVMRKLALNHGEGTLPDPKAALEDPIEALSVAGSHPLWLVRDVAGIRGTEATEKWVAANNLVPDLALRTNPLRGTRKELKTLLEARDLVVTSSPLLPQALTLRGAGQVTELPGFSEGRFSVQDIAAQVVGLLANVQGRDVVLDACAAPGGKTAHLAELMQDHGRVVAMDVHTVRTRLIAETAERLGLASIDIEAGDSGDPDELARVLSDRDIAAFDVAVVDAPCSGLGTLRRHPELRQRRDADFRMLCNAQDKILNAVASVVRPGGALVYSVCTVTQAECEDRIEAFLECHDQWRLDPPQNPELAPFLSTCCGVENGALRSWTDLHGTDSFFAARLVRSGTITGA